MLPLLFEWNENENAAPAPGHATFGLILPSGKGSDIRQLFHDANTRFIEIGKVYAKFFNLSEQQLACLDEDVSLKA